MNTEGSILSKQIVIKLNARWFPIAQITVEDAVTFLCGQAGKPVNGYVIDYETITDENGEQSLAYTWQRTWDEWMALPIRSTDLTIGTSRGPVRVPTVVICADYTDITTTTMRWSTGNVRKRYKDTCQVSGRKLKPSEGNTGHDVPQSKGGQSNWRNTTYIDKKLNTLQGTRTFKEMGWRLINEPCAPKPVPVLIRKSQAALEDQKPFLLPDED